MGQMKAFGMKLARMIYENKMSDEQIINIIKQRYPASTSGPDDKWLKEQIKAVRDNPKAWRSISRRDG